MRDESTKQATQEYLATKLTEEPQRYEAEQNYATAVARSITVWRRLRDSLLVQCREWDAVADFAWRKRVRKHVKTKEICGPENGGARGCHWKPFLPCATEEMESSIHNA